MSYADSIDYWSKWAAVPLDCAVTLVLGEDPEDFDGFDAGDFILLKALAMSHATSGQVQFKAPNNSATWFDDPVVYLPAFGAWAESVGHTLRDEFPRIQANLENPTSMVADTLGRREQQHEIILAVIAALEFDAQQIPDGGKAKIKSICLTRANVFTDTGFVHAWKAGLSAGLFKLANHEKYSPN